MKTYQVVGQPSIHHHGPESVSFNISAQSSQDLPQQLQAQLLCCTAEALVLEQQLGVLLNAKLDEYEDSKSAGSSVELGHERDRFKSEADAMMQQLVALKKYINDHAQ